MRTGMEKNKGSRSAALPGSSHLEHEVLNRYARGAERVENALCCPATEYAQEFLHILPKEILETDYGCGDPSKHVQAGEVVVDLGSGSGKICYILAQKTGQSGRVIGVDFNPAMLALARKHKPAIAQRMGFDNVSFVRARIQDMALDLEAAEAWLREHPVESIASWSDFETECERLRRSAPAVANEAADVVVSNCVLNLVKPEDKAGLFEEIYRILKSGGRAVISDIVCDEDPTQKIMADQRLWSGCIAGAFREDRLLERFAQAGFYGVEVLSRQSEPWQVIDGVEFRALTVRAFKGKEGPCLERRQAVIYKGPFSQVTDDDGHVFERGKRAAVCDKTFRILTNPAGPYAAHFDPVPPYESTPLDSALAFDCRRSALRDPRETKGQEYRETRLSDPNSGPCQPGKCC